MTRRLDVKPPQVYNNNRCTYSVRARVYKNGVPGPGLFLKTGCLSEKLSPDCLQLK